MKVKCSSVAALKHISQSSLVVNIGCHVVIMEGYVVKIDFHVVKIEIDVVIVKIWNVIKDQIIMDSGIFN